MFHKFSLLRYCLSYSCKELKFLIPASFVWGLSYCRLLFSSFDKCIFAPRTCMQNAAADAVTLSVLTAVTGTWLPLLYCKKYSLHLLICREYLDWLLLLCLSNIISYWNKAASIGSVDWAPAMVQTEDFPLSAVKEWFVKTQKVGH